MIIEVTFHKIHVLTHSLHNYFDNNWQAYIILYRAACFNERTFNGGNAV